MLRSLLRSMSFSSSNGVRLVQLGLLRSVRNDPWNSFVPLLVIVLMMPPEKRPYSAEMPEVSTCIWSIASSI